VLPPARWVGRQRHGWISLPGLVAARRDPKLVPGGKDLDVGGEDVLRGHGDPHREDRPRENEVGGLTPGTVDCGGLKSEVVGGRLQSATNIVPPCDVEMLGREGDAERPGTRPPGNLRSSPFDPATSLL